MIQKDHNRCKDEKADDIDKRIQEILKLSAVDRERDGQGNVSYIDEGHEEVAKAWDDLTGVELGSAVVRKSRMTEVGYTRWKNVWTQKIPKR